MIALGFLASGDGHGFQIIHAASVSGELDVSVNALAAEKKCKAIEKAESAGVPVVFQPWGPYKRSGRLRETYDRDLAARLRMHGVELVLIDGWERELTSGFLEIYTGRILDLAVAAHAPVGRERLVESVRAALVGSARSVHG